MSTTFGVVDYMIFIAMLMMSTAIGLYWSWKDRNNTDANEFLRGGNHMSVLPVCMSIMASFMYSTSIIGIPAYVYFTGTQIWVTVVPAVLAATIACEIFIPVYYRMKLVSVNQYIHLRFNSHKLRVVANISILVSYGASESGGIAQAFDRAYIGGRIEFWNTSQLQVQRSVSMPTLRAAKRALYCAVPGCITILSLIVLTGVLMYARYYDCDPMRTGRVHRPDQLVPYFVTDIFGDRYPGMTGVFVAAVFSSSLSTLSSGLNAVSSLIYDDYGKRWVPQKQAIWFTKLLAVAIGLLTIMMAFVMSEMNSILECTFKLYGATNGPMFALFCMGLFCPWANSWGVGFGFITGQLFGIWLTIGSVVDKQTDVLYMALPTSTDGCATQNITVIMPGANLSTLTHYKIPQYYPTGYQLVHHMSPLYVPTITFLITLILGNVVSLLTLGNKDQTIDPNLVHLNVCRMLEKILPQSWQQFQTKADEMVKMTGQSTDGGSDRLPEAETPLSQLSDQQSV
ncbi:unnamed protein product [Medioppia subpectinata]|uniref:Sodium-coupled monocarboxylate transporter 1 n=1 Tax=Medioppia subpectinata TaxID=1979941 RepID=A0A7R9Q0W1_9ACAR|nr:unnamed protein product [Medioppia subpectinata]CAG2108394.1 unnamed protein product [Medioppia subpectinata]